MRERGAKLDKKELIVRQNWNRAYNQGPTYAIHVHIIQHDSIIWKFPREPECPDYRDMTVLEYSEFGRQNILWPRRGDFLNRRPKNRSYD